MNDYKIAWEDLKSTIKAFLEDVDKLKNYEQGQGSKFFLQGTSYAYKRVLELMESGEIEND